MPMRFLDAAVVARSALSLTASHGMHELDCRNGKSIARIRRVVSVRPRGMMPINISDFLFPRELSVSNTNLRKVMVVGTCMAEQIAWRAGLQRPDISFDLHMTNNAAELPSLSSEAVQAYDLIYAVCPLRDFVTDRVVEFSAFGHDHQDIQRVAIDRLEQFFHAVTEYSRTHGTLTIVSNFQVPQASVATSVIEAWGPRDFSHLVRHLNEHLAELIRAERNVYLADIDAIGNSLGKNTFLDDTVQFYAHGGYFSECFLHYDLMPVHNPAGARIEPLPNLSEIYNFKEGEYFSALWRQVETIYRIVNQVDIVKLVVFDLDDTLWRGQLAEHYGDAGGWPIHVGWPLGIWEAIQHLRARGILVAICSKNDESLVRERWSRGLLLPWVKMEDFAFIEIGWRPKAEAIAGILRQASLTAKSAVFIDDNPVERAAVEAALPGIRTLGADPYLIRRVLLWSSETQLARVSDETSRRQEMVAAQTQREAARVSMSREEFLSRLNCRVDITRLQSAADPRFARALELINKTNQFNTTGERLTYQDLSSFLVSGGKVYIFSVADIYTQYGVVGVVRLRDNVFVQVVMSCRVIGLGVEQGVVRHIMAQEPFASFEATVHATQANAVCRDLFAKLGFTLADDGAYRTIGQSVAETPGHLTILAA